MPLSLIILVQANNTSPAAIRKIQKIGSMIQPLITGERGNAALLSFGSRSMSFRNSRTIPIRLTNAFHSINIQSGKTARMIDGIAEALHMFGARPNNEHRILFVIGEIRDRGSKTKLNDAVKTVQLEGVSVFPVVFSAYVTQFTARPSDLPPPEDVDLLAAITEPGRLLGKADAAHALSIFGRTQDILRDPTGPGEHSFQFGRGVAQPVHSQFHQRVMRARAASDRREAEGAPGCSSSLALCVLDRPGILSERWFPESALAG